MTETMIKVVGCTLCTGMKPLHIAEVRATGENFRLANMVHRVHHTGWRLLGTVAWVPILQGLGHFQAYFA